MSLSRFHSWRLQCHPSDVHTSDPPFYFQQFQPSQTILNHTLSGVREIQGCFNNTQFPLSARAAFVSIHNRSSSRPNQANTVHSTRELYHTVQGYRLKRNMWMPELEYTRLFCGVYCYLMIQVCWRARPWSIQTTYFNCTSLRINYKNGWVY